VPGIGLAAPMNERARLESSGAGICATARCGRGMAALVAVVWGTLASNRSLPAQTVAVPDAVQADAHTWPVFRGNPQQTGVAVASLPDKLEVVWTFDAPDVIVSTAAIARGTVYVGCDDAHLYALDLRSGKPKWTFAASESVRASPTVYRDLVLFGDGAGVVHAVGAERGDSRWTFKTDGEIISSVNVAGERAVFGSYDGFIYCLNPADGRPLWKFETAGRVHGTPAVADGRVIAAGCDEYLHVLDLADGKPLSKVSMASVSGASAAVSGARAFVGTMGNTVLGIDWKSSRVAWVFKDEEREFPFMSSSAVTDRQVIFGGRDKFVRALDPGSGRQLWRFETKGRVETSPVVAGGRVYVASYDGNVYALDAAAGREVWRFESGSSFSASPAVADGRMVISTEDGRVYCFGAR